MADEVSNFYSKPSGYHSKKMKQMGGGPMSAIGKFGIPLWQGIKDKIVEMAPAVLQNIKDKIVSTTQNVKPRIKRKRPIQKKKRVRFTSDDYRDDEPKIKRRRYRSQIGQVLGDDTY